MSMSNNEIKVCKSCGYQGVMLGDDCDKCGSLWTDVVDRKLDGDDRFTHKSEVSKSDLGLMEVVE